jgi:hypothetical protein
MTRKEAQAFAEQWASDWNKLAVERVLEHFDDRVAFTSPTAAAVVGLPTVSGKQALRDYWNKALARWGHCGSSLIASCGTRPAESWLSSTSPTSAVESGASQRT